MRLGVVGSRRRNTLFDRDILFSFIKRAKELFPNISLISGGCNRGADKFAEYIATSLSIPIIIHLPDRTKLPPNPQRWDFTRINYARNILIAKDCDVLVALPASDRKGGTEHTIKETQRLNKKVILL